MPEVEDTQLILRTEETDYREYVKRLAHRLLDGR